MNKSPVEGSAALKVTLVHDWLTGMRGGEKVLELLCTRFPDAPLWTLLHVPGSVSDTISQRTIHTSPMQWLPRYDQNTVTICHFFLSWRS